MSTIMRPAPLPSPRRLIPPAAPSLTAYPIIERAVTNSPGTCSDNVGSTLTRWFSVSLSLLTTDMVIGRWRMSVTLRVPVTTTLSRVCAVVSLWACTWPAAAVRRAAAKISFFIKNQEF